MLRVVVFGLALLPEYSFAGGLGDDDDGEAVTSNVDIKVARKVRETLLQTATKVCSSVGYNGAPTPKFPGGTKHADEHKASNLDLWFTCREVERTISTTDVSAIEKAKSAVDQLKAVNYMSKNENPRGGGEGQDVQAAELEGRQRPLFTPNDECWDGDGPNTGNYVSIGMQGAWDLHTGSDDIVVAVIDTGMAADHPDAQHRWENPLECGVNANNGIDDDGNGFVDDCNGYNFAEGEGGGDLEGDGAHGAHCAGTIGMTTNNGIGCAGMAGGGNGHNGIRLMTLTVFGKTVQGGFSTAIVYAADNGAAIASNSWGGAPPSQAMQEALAYFNQKANSGKVKAEHGQETGGIIVFAAGNSGKDENFWPASFEEAVAVAAVDDNHKPAYFTTHGSQIDVSAPGVSIYSLSTGKGYQSMSGTSMACPTVAGAFALMVSAFPGLRREDYLKCLFSTSTEVKDIPSQDKSKYGAGVIRPKDALLCLGNFPPFLPPPPSSPPAPPAAPMTPVVIELKSDNYPAEFTYEIFDKDDKSIIKGGTVGMDAYTTKTETFKLFPGDYKLTMSDAFGDGICCSQGNGYIKVWLNEINGDLLTEGGEFGQIATKEFSLGLPSDPPASPPPLSPSCDSTCLNNLTPWRKQCKKAKCKPCQQCQKLDVCWKKSCKKIEEPWQIKCDIWQCTGCKQCKAPTRCQEGKCNISDQNRRKKCNEPKCVGCEQCRCDWGCDTGQTDWTETCKLNTCGGCSQCTDKVTANALQPHLLVNMNDVDEDRNTADEASDDDSEQELETYPQDEPDDSA